MKIGRIALLFVITISLIISGCKGKEEKSNNEIAKEYLQNGSYDLAYKYFSKELSEKPNDGEALIGSAVSQFLSLIVDFANYIASVSGINRSEGIPRGSFDIMGTNTEKEDILKVAIKLLSGLIVRWEKMDEAINLAKEKGTALKIESLPVYWNMKKVMELGGKIDRTDMYFLSILSKLFLSTVKFFLSQELDLDIYEIYTQYIHLKNKMINGNPIPTPLLIMNLVVQQLNDPEVRLLYLSNWDLNENGIPDGSEFYTYPLDSLKEIYLDLMNLIKIGLSEPVSSNEVVIVLDEKKGKEFASKIGDKSYENIFENIKYDIILYNRLYLNNVTTSVEIYIDNNGLSALQRIYSHLVTHTPERLGLHRDIFPVVSVVASTILSFISKTDIIELPDMLKNILSIGPIYPSVINGLLAGFVPDVMEFDLRTFFSNPVSFRTLLPPWRKDPVNPEENLFFLEWDTTLPYEPGVLSQYPLDGPFGIILPQSIIPEDVDHFTAGVYNEELYRGYRIRRIAKDTLATPLPYISFRNNDASFNKLLYLNFANDENGLRRILNLTDYYGTNDYPSEFSPATARDFNALLGYFYKKFNLGNYIYK